MFDSPRVLLPLSLGMGRGGHPKTILLNALFCQSTPSWLKVGGGGGWWWVACEIILSSLSLSLSPLVLQLMVKLLKHFVSKRE